VADRASRNDAGRDQLHPGVPTTVLSTQPAVSVVIISYNARRHLGPCLRSLLGDAALPTEVILVDNASGDGSAEYVEETFRDVRLLHAGANRGFGAASNLAARHARGQYLAFLNPDTVVEPGWLAPLVAALQADPRAALATPKIVLHSDPTTINTGGNDIHCSGLTLCRGAGLSREQLDHAAEVSAISGAAFAVRKDVFEQLGGFDEHFFLYMEDADLSLRAGLAGNCCLYVPQSVVQHDYALRFGPRKTYYQERNRYLMLLKTLRWPTLLILTPVLALGEVVTWGFVFLHDRRRAANKLRAYAWVVRHGREILDARRETQKLRRVSDRSLLAATSYRLAFEQTGDGFVARVAHVVFDPLFLLLRHLALALVRW